MPSPSSSLVQWTDADGRPRQARWQSESGAPAPARIEVIDDRMPADAAYRKACEGTALLWRGDFHNARQLLQAMARRLDKRPPKLADTPRERFNQHRMWQAQRARTLGRLLVEIGADGALDLRRAPAAAPACAAAGIETPCLMSLRELQGLLGAHEWQKKGVPIPALDGQHIHPCYGVYSPVRGEYIDLVARAPLPQGPIFDIGTGTGVLAAVLARRGSHPVTATDLDPRALACARDNLRRLGLEARVSLRQADLFPEGRAALIVCNPPWLPAKPSSPIEHAVYDPDSRMLRAFLQGLPAHLLPGGEGWLILSDLAEHLGLRGPDELQDWIAQAGLRVIERHTARPLHPRARDDKDPLHMARSRELTSLWRLAIA
ncbi:methyltransferase [Bordetella pseudohinzii]|uniref:Methylase n=1 Tax=Bordetella pseudohinzii TaxID=1331258 RepID=A0A0J6C1T6_9BORD|nr:class I SAM-dependent methyltransferase [Bordetella pseudohinzii]ANY17104.1 methylase [Bordetella pseudohinzii]KMM25013.1 methylase [Bordetella pseudohinzii]KXA75623.1 methylase [Bordetella pseudohinzii]KXA77073.1 methylase [Bordetella pseudohinzii]CUI99806.1 N5-glutamine S-adenosyl-L-methionine-dependent methyltransferase [Bordetella pseudohinzii]